MVRARLGVVTIFSLFFSQLLFGTVKFKQSAFTFEVPSGVPYTLNFIDLVKPETVITPLTWNKVGAAPPSWLTPDYPNAKASGTPPVVSTPATGTFRLGVADGDSGAFADITFVWKVIPAWTSFTLPDATEDSPYFFDLKTKVSVPSGGGTITFPTHLASGLPSWMTMTADGILGGTPRRVNVGPFSNVKFTAQSASGGSSEVTTSGQVLVNPKCPTFIMAGITLPDAQEDFDYSKDLLNYVNKPDPEPHTINFQILSADPKADWFKVATSGLVSGKPTKPNLGSQEIRVQLSTTLFSKVCSQEATLTITVKHTNHTPVWSQNTITLPDGVTWAVYNQSVASFASDPDGDVLTFSKVSGPAWASINATTGAITGTPDRPDIGDNTIVVAVSDGEFAPQTTVKIKIIKGNEPPFWNNKPVVLDNAQEDFLYSKNLNLAQYVTDPDGDPIVFTKMGGPAWLTVNSDGTVSGTPGKNDLGLNTFQIKINDNKVAGSDTADVKITVLHTNHTPVWSQNPITMPNAQEDFLFTFESKSFASDPDGDPLTFKKISGPAWISVDATGKLSGTPGAGDLGNFSVEIEVSDGEFKPTTIATSVVIHTNHAPKWTQDPIILQNGNERELYSVVISGFASDPDPGDVLTFRKISGASWASVTNGGTLFGTPQRVDVGHQRIVVRATDQNGLFKETAFEFEVIKVNQLPIWSNPPITLADAFEDSAYTFSVANLVTDPDGDALTFKKISGPNWNAVSSAGLITGTPTKPDIGNYSMVIEVSDGEAAVQVTANGKVIHVNHAPVIGTIPLITVVERDIKTVSLKSYVSDIDDGDVLTFTLVGSYDWFTLDSSGNLRMTPKYKNLGDHVVTFKVSDGKAEASSPFTIQVQRAPQVPVWTGPIEFNIPYGKLFTSDISAFASDLDGAPLTFAKVSGASWLNMSAEGVLSGTPPESAVATSPHTFVVSAKNDAFTANTNVVITVYDPNGAPIWNPTTIDLGNTDEKKPYSTSLVSFASDPDGDPLTFSKISGPAWVSISSTGTFSGTPQRPDVGPNTVIVRVSDNHGKSADATVKITVNYVNQDPVWTQKPLSLPDAHEDVAFNYDISIFATDPDIDPLSFSKISGPDWLLVASNGALSGTPGKNDVTPLYNAVFGVSDGKVMVQVDATGRVLHTNHLPQINPNPFEITMKEREELTKALKDIVVDSDGDALTFNLQGAKDWTTLATDGTLTLKPKFKDIGVHTFTYKVSDGTTPVDGSLKITVLRDPRPPEWKANPIVIRTPAKQPIQGTLKTYVTDPDGLTLTFSKESGPDWLTVATDGTLGGTPGISELGDNFFVVQAKNDMLGATTTLKVEVYDPNHAPEWTKDPIVLPNAKEKVAYSQSIKSFATDPDTGDTLTITKIDGPAWASFGTDGAVTGTPQRSDVGLNTFTVRVTDNGGKFDEAKVQITVEYVNQAPLWSQNPIDLPNAFEDVAYTFDLTPFASDPDGDPITFKKLSGSSWLSISSDGKVTGTPKKADIGTFTAQVEISDGKLTAVATIRGNVIHTNHPPTVPGTAIALTVKERETKLEDLKKYITDVDGDVLAFTLADGKDWTVLATNGVLTMKPIHKDIGEHTFTVNVSDGNATATASLKITVIRDPQKPVWNPTVITFRAPINKPFSESIQDKVTDPDGMALTITKKSGPGWLSVASDGSLTGTPLQANLGSNSFIVTATNDGQSADATVVIDVYDPTSAPKWTKDPIDLGHIPERDPYSHELAQYVTDPDGDSITFTKVSGPAWATISPTGTFSGTPQRANVGQNTFVVKATDSTQKSSNVTVLIFVDKVNQKPKWTVDPLVLADAFENAEYNFDVKPYVTDADGDALTFTKKSGPGWQSLSSDGKLSGTPKTADIGNYTAVFTVSDGIDSVDVNAQGRVLDVDHDPIINPSVIKLTVKEREVKTENLAQYVTDADGDPITYALVDTKDWLALDVTTGLLTMKPVHKDLGVHTVRFSATDGNRTRRLASNKRTTATLEITVVRDAQAPVWLENPIYFETTTNILFKENIASKVKELDGVPLTFSKISGAAWLTVQSDGTLTGTPKKIDVGTTTFVVQAKNDLLGANVDVIIKVNPGNEPPKWLKDPIDLGKIQILDPFTFDVAQYATDPDGDKLTFTNISGPSWLFLSPDGIFSGTPQSKDLGVFTGVVQVSDGKLTATANYFGKVVNEKNHPPEVKPGSLYFVVKEFETLNVALNDPQYVVDPEGDAMFFELTPVQTWVTVSPQGNMVAKPKHPELGDHTFNLKITDEKGLSTNAALFIRVIPNPIPPVWLEDPIRFTAYVDKNFVATVADKVTNPYGGTLTIVKRSGPEWMMVSPNGALSGVPLLANLGENGFLLSASNGAMTSFARVIVTVLNNQDQTDKEQVDKAVPGAPVDNIWVVDNHIHCNVQDDLSCLIKKNIHLYLQELTSAQIHHTAVMLTSDGTKQGEPRKGQDGSTLMTWNQNNWVADFKYRYDSWAVGNCLNTPIYSLYKFLEKAANFSFYHKDFIRPGVPLDIMMSTRRKDYYDRFTNKSVDEMVQSYVDFGNREMNKLRVSAIAPDCTNTGFAAIGDPVEAASNPYRTAVDRTGGEYYPYKCPIKIDLILKDYAQKVIFRAYVMAKKSIALSHTPNDPSKITVSIGGKMLSDDQWDYDVPTNSVKIYWDKIDLFTIQPGSFIEIKYQY